MSILREAFLVTLLNPVEKKIFSLLFHQLMSHPAYLILALLLRLPVGKLEPILQHNFAAELLQEI